MYCIRWIVKLLRGPGSYLKHCKCCSIIVSIQQNIIVTALSGVLKHYKFCYIYDTGHKHNIIVIYLL